MTIFTLVATVGSGVCAVLLMGQGVWARERAGWLQLGWLGCSVIAALASMFIGSLLVFLISVAMVFVSAVSLRLYRIDRAKRQIQAENESFFA